MKETKKEELEFFLDSWVPYDKDCHSLDKK